jgi:hypothetical protein
MVVLGFELVLAGQALHHLSHSTSLKAGYFPVKVICQSKGTSDVSGESSLPVSSGLREESSFFFFFFFSKTRDLQMCYSSIAGWKHCSGFLEMDGQRKMFKNKSRHIHELAQNNWGH